MPLYEYKCETCGIFDQWRALAELSNPVFCPTCQATAKRVFSVPNVNLSSGSSKLRGQSKEPQLIKRSQDKEPTPPKIQTHPHGRPWMISH